ncbi:MAG TPA: UDP-N-acetylmuramyl-tripeptide synthetase [Candidatus Paceibacterota bacterium]
MEQTLKTAVSRFFLAPPYSLYHFCLAFLSALYFGFPSRRLIVVGVTGTKGKSSTIEFANAAFEAAGYTTALASTIRTKIASQSKANTRRMTMPGRFFLQDFLKCAIDAKCAVAFIEMTSEGARQHRHRFIALDALVFTNLAPEHIESHGSYEAYANAKFSLGKALVSSSKRPRIIIANADDRESARYLTLPVEHAIPFSPSAFDARANEGGGTFRMDDTNITIHLPGTFSLQNAIAAALLARAFDIRTDAIRLGFDALKKIPGRAERIHEGQPFLVVVDYAHTPDSLSALYDTYPNRKKICVLGATGGGRDHWKRPVMGSIASASCEHVILTNEDPYDESPDAIIKNIAAGMKKQPEIILDRRAAIARALSLANNTGKECAVLITGKGTDPTIEGPRGNSTTWSDAEVTREELKKMVYNKSV